MTKVRPVVLNSTSCGTIATEVAVQVGIIASIVFFALIEYYRYFHVNLSLLVGVSLGGPRTEQVIRRGLHRTFLLLVTSHCVRFVAPTSCLLELPVPSSSWVPLPAAGRVEVCARPRPLRRPRCLVNGVLPSFA